MNDNNFINIAFLSINYLDLKVYVYYNIIESSRIEICNNKVIPKF